MAAIQETIELKDSFSPIITNIVNSVNYAVSAMEQLRGAMKGKVDDSALKAARESVNGLNDSMRQAEEAAKATNKSMKQVAGSADNAGSAMKSASTQTDNLGSSMKQAAGSAGDAGNAFKQTESSIKGTENALKQTEDAARNASGSFSNAASSFSNLLVAFGGYKILEYVKDAFLASASAAIEFESAITGVYKTVDGSSEQLAKISSDIRQMSTEIPATTTEIAGVAEAAGQLGIATDDITDFTEVMINLGESTNLSADEAASSLAKFANITGMSAENYENLGSSIVALGNNFATTETDIVSMATKMASAGELAGLSEADILGLSTAVSSVGIEAEAGGTAISKLLTDIQTAVETGNDSLEDFASVAGMSVEQFSTLFETRAVDALTAFISGLNDVERNGRSATVILDDMEINEVRLSNTIKSLANNSDGMTNAIDMASTAWEQNSALTNEVQKRYSTLESKFQLVKNDANDLKIAVGDVLTPALGGLSDIAQNVLKDLTGFAKEHPSIVTGITAMAGAFTVLSKAALAVKTLKTALDMLNISLKGLGKATLIGLGISAAVGGIAAAASHFKKAKNDIEDYNGTMEQCRQEIENTQAALETAKGAYSGNSEVVKSLQSDLDTLNAQYEKGGGYMQVLADKAHAAYESFQKLDEATKQQTESIDASEIAGLKAISYLQRMSEKADLTNADLKMMGSYADYLNDTFECNIKVNYDTGKVTGINPQDIVDKIKSKSDEKRQKAAIEYLSDTQNIDSINAQQEALNEAKKEAEKLKNKYGDVGIKAYEYQKNHRTKKGEVDLAFPSTQKKYDNFFDKMGFKSSWGNSRVKQFDDYINEVDAAYAKVNKAENELNETISTSAGYCEDAGISAKDWLENVVYGGENAVGSITNMADAVAAAKESLETGVPNIGIQAFIDSIKGVKEELTIDDAAADIWDKYSKRVTNLATAYEEAYTSIRSSLDNMFGLFDTAEMKAEKAATYEKLEESQQSQLNYLNQWEEAAKKLSELGLNQNIIDQSTPEQVVGLADSFDRLKESAGDSAVADELEKINSQAKELGEKKDTVAETLTLMKEDISTQMGALKTDMENDMKEAAKRLNVSSEAADAGNDTMSALAHAVATKGADVIDAAQEVKIRVQSILSSISADVSVNAHVAAYGPLPLSATKYAAHANGTTNAEDIFIAGENGPELIVGKRGSTVFPTSETNRIIAAISGTNSADARFSTAPTINNTFFNTVNNTISSEINNAKNYDDSSLKSVGDPTGRIVDLSLLGRAVNNYRTENISNFDYSRRLENVINYGDSIRNAETAYNSDYSRQLQNSVNYGDSIRSSDLIYNQDYIRESNHITNYSDNYNRIFMAENPGESQFAESKKTDENSEKIITIKLDVNGAATTLGSTNKAEIVEVMLDNLKPVLSQILSQEAFEEGDNSYDY